MTAPNVIKSNFHPKKSDYRNGLPYLWLSGLPERHSVTIRH